MRNGQTHVNFLGLLNHQPTNAEQTLVRFAEFEPPNQLTRRNTRVTVSTDLPTLRHTQAWLKHFFSF